MVSTSGHTISSVYHLNYSGACFSKVSKHFGPLSGATIPVLSLQRRGSKTSNFTFRPRATTEYPSNIVFLKQYPLKNEANLFICKLVAGYSEV